MAWNIGVGSTVTSPPRNGRRDSGPPNGASERGCWRAAPFGVPVVPLVRMMSDACRPGAGGEAGLPAATSASRVSAARSPSVVVHARKRPLGASTSATTSANSSS
jgi:hypothetical protein